MTPRNRTIGIGLVLLHTALVLAYTLPKQLVPQRIQGVSVAYVRPLFHQSWQLFAPDPPMCSCEVEVILNNNDIRPIDLGKGYLQRRMAQTIARSVQQELAQGDTMPHPELVVAMQMMVRDIGRGSSDLHFQLREECAVDANEPMAREVNITPLETVE